MTPTPELCAKCSDEIRYACSHEFVDGFPHCVKEIKNKIINILRLDLDNEALHKELIKLILTIN